MKTSRTSIWVLALLFLVFLGYLGASYGQLPEMVATHFDLEGHPNGWMSRRGHLFFILGLGILFPAVLPGLVALSRFLPDSSLNLPNREYWLSPQRRGETRAFLGQHALWFSSLAVIFTLGVHHLIVRANLQPGVRLSPLMLWSLVGGLLLGLALWITILVRRFALPKSSSSRK